MNLDPSSYQNPFSDFALSSREDHEAALESTLPVGPDASLTFDARGIIVADNGFDNEDRSRLCGLVSKSAAAKTIPYFHILDANLSNNILTIKYTKPKSSKKDARLSVETLIYPISAPADRAQRWMERVIENAYGPVQRNRRIKVLVNPYGGAGKAPAIYAKLVAPIFAAAGCEIDVERTTHKAHAVDVAGSLDIDRYDVLACLSGDGLPMECFNGLARKRNAAEALRKISIVQIPCGTGNAMSWNLFGTGEPTIAALMTVKGVRTSLDLASVTQGDKRTLSFLSQSVGVVAESDLGTDNIRWMGDFRFTFGFLVRLLGKTLYPIELAVKTEIEDKTEIKKHYAREMARRQNSPVASHDILDKELEAQTGLGLPPLKHGTINDPLPKDQSSGWTKLQAYPNLGNLYCGNMCWMAADAPFFPASLPNDGLLDLVCVDGDISRISAVKMLLEVGSGAFFDNNGVSARKISAIRVIPKYGRQMTERNNNNNTQTESANNTTPPAPQKPSPIQRILNKLFGSPTRKDGCFSVDGERMPFEPFQIEVHRGLGTSLSRVPGVYEYEGPRGWRDLQIEDTRSAALERS